MKILMLSQGRRIEDQSDFDAALRSAKTEGEAVELLNIPYIGYVEKHGGEAFYREVVRISKEFKPDLVFFQFFHSANPGDPRPCVAEIRASRNRPLIFGSLGDPFNTGMLHFLGRPIPKCTHQLASVADAFFSTSMGAVAETLAMSGVRNIVFLPHAYLTKQFPLPNLEYKPEKKHDIVMVGSKCPVFTKRPLVGLTRGLVRNAVVDMLAKRFGNRFSVFGGGWCGPCAHGMVPFDNQIAAIASGRVSVDAPAPINVTYYASDRPFFIAGSGTPLVMRHVPRFEKLLRDGKNVFFAQSISEIPDVCAKVLEMGADELEQNRRDTIELVGTRHLIANRMDTLLSVYEALSKVRKGDLTADTALEHLRLWHFLPDIDLADELRYAVRNWQG
jgi:hypothetical protein